MTFKAVDKLETIKYWEPVKLLQEYKNKRFIQERSKTLSDNLKMLNSYDIEGQVS